jgi:hypothetical protein
MCRTLRCLVFVVLFGQLIVACRGAEYPERWVFVSSSLRNDRDVGNVEKIVETAAQHGLNGMVLSAGLDRLDKQPPEFLERLRQVREFCREKGVEIVPNIFSAGYGGSVLAYNRNLAAGIPVPDAPFLVKDGEARLAPEKAVAIVNGGFEEYQGQRVRGFGFHDRPGEVSFVDTAVFRSGKASLRFENFGKFEHGHARLMQEVEVQPNRCYRLSCWVKTAGLEPRGAFRITVLSPEGRDLAPYDPRVPGTTDWHRVVMGFNSLGCDKVRIYAGAWGGKAGRFWIDDLAIEEVALLNVLRRPGTPVAVRSEQGGEVYQEGKDFGPIRDERLNFRFDHEPPTIKILPGGRIKDGERLRVSYYHGMGVNNGQVSVCMSEPEVYEIWARQARLMQEHLAPAKYLLSMDEIRAGGSCEACKQRHLSMAQILGDCITKQVGILRHVNPKAEVLIWSDMLDPNHNAHGNYYLVEGDYTGSWNYVPQDLTIVCWYYEKRNESLGFFSAHGFRTLAGAYYDGDTLENPRGWLAVLDKTPKAVGIMYTTWQDKYELLGPFGDLVAGQVKQEEPFVPLFNDKNLDGWINVNCAPETWTVRDGTIVCTGVPTGVLRTKKQYENYVLEVEWRHMQKGGNAGLFVHSDPLPVTGQPFTRAIEVQILDGNAGDVFGIQGATMTPDQPHPKGWMRALPHENRMNPQGQWNHYRVECRDGMISLAVNGTEVTRGYHTNPRKGYICLESEGSEVHFRNIRIHELPDSNPPPEVVARTDQGFRSLYNGLDLRGWKPVPGNEGHWRAKDWILDYDGKSQARGEDKNLWTEQAFSDFVLIVDWRLAREPRLEFVPVVLPDGSQAVDAQGTPRAVAVMDGGDSGVYLRGTSKGQVNMWSWPVGSGELWGYRTDITMPAEVRRAATPILNADNPPGRWNRFEITARGERVSIKLNGQIVIRDAQLPGLPAQGPLALQHHGDPVQFANIYIRELKAGE